MSKFTFRLETMLRLCVARRDGRRVELAETLARAQLVEHQIAAVDGKLRAPQQAQTAPPGPVDVDRLLASDRYGAALRADKLRCAQHRAVLAAEIAQRRDTLLAVDREVRTLERLREKQRARFQADHQRREQRELDEVSTRGLANRTDP